MKDASKCFHALANDNRLAIFEFLRQNEQVCVEPEEGNTFGDIAQQFDLALSTVSHHLRVLHEAGLVTCKRQGQFTYCAINWDTVNDLREFLTTK